MIETDFIFIAFAKIIDICFSLPIHRAKKSLSDSQIYELDCRCCGWFFNGMHMLMLQKLSKICNKFMLVFKKIREAALRKLFSELSFGSAIELLCKFGNKRTQTRKC